MIASVASGTVMPVEPARVDEPLVLGVRDEGVIVGRPRRPTGSTTGRISQAELPRELEVALVVRRHAP